MPHLFLNRPRVFDGKLAPDEVLGHFKWEIINGVFYQIGGFLLLVGSILFRPENKDLIDIGSCSFIMASSLYMAVSTQDLWEVCSHQRAAESNKKKKYSNILDFLSAAAYLIGTLCFISGRILFLPSVGFSHTGAYMFIIGSILFVLGAVVNSVQIYDSPTQKASLYANLTAVTYIIGSTFYLAGSVPYLWEFENPHDQKLINRWLADQFIVGSILFIVGGSFNILRAKAVVDHYLSYSKIRSTDSSPSTASEYGSLASSNGQQVEVVDGSV